MALPTKRVFRDLGKLITSSNSAPVARIGTEVEIGVIHELGIGAEGMPVTEYRVIPPSQFHTLVTFKSQVVGQLPSQSPSVEYTATVRRRKARRLAESISELAAFCDRSDFTAWTFPVLKQIKDLILTLADAEREGNTREILRQLRDTFMNGGWEAYRRSDARTLAYAIVDHLANAVEVTPKDANAAFDKLCQLGLNPVGQFLHGTETEKDADGQEDEVSG